jgi:O-antigen ligase/tetratricopeptide (TPR) repeat protein
MKGMWPYALRGILARSGPLRAAGRVTEAARAPQGVTEERWDQATAPLRWPHPGRTAIATAGLAALIAYLALTPLPPFASDVYGSLVRRHIVLGVVLLGYAVWCVARRRLTDPTPLDLPLAALTLVLLFAAWRSSNPRVSIEALLPLLPTLVLFYVVSDVQALDARALAWAVVMSAAVVACFALASVWRATGEWWTLVRAVEGGLSRGTLLPPAMPRVAEVGNHPNVLAAVFAAALPPALFLWGGARASWQRAALTLAAMLCTAALVFTLSRAAWAGAAAGVAVTVAGFVLVTPGGPRPVRRLALVIGAFAAVALLLTLALLASGARPDWLFRDSLGPRADLRRAGWEIFLDHPLTGAGPGLFTALYPLYEGVYPFAAVHTHNIVVQTAVDAGVLGLVAGAFLLGTIVVLVIAGLRAGQAGQRRAVAAAAGMLVAVGVHALADSPQLFPEVQLLCVAALVMVLRRSHRKALTPDPSPNAGRGELNSTTADLGTPSPNAGRGGRGVRAFGATGRVLALLLAVILPLAWVAADRAHGAADRGLRAARREDWPAAVAALQQAADRDERMPAYWFQLGAAHASAAIEGERTVEQRAALLAMQRGLELEPHNGAALANAAALNVALGRPAAARDRLPALAEIAGRDSLLVLAHATLTQWTAPPEEAIETYAGLLVLNPTLAATPFWQGDTFRAANFDRIVDRALVRVPEVAGGGAGADSLRTAIAVYAGRSAPAVAALEAALAARPNDVALRVAAGRLLMTAEPTRPRAFALLDGAVRLKGDDPGARAALGDWYARAGDLPHARREWMAAAYLGDPGAAVALGNSYPPGAVPGPVVKRAEALLRSVELTRFYLIFQTFRFTFQRAEPAPIILPGDWLMALPPDLPAWQAAVERWQRR